MADVFCEVEYVQVLIVQTKFCYMRFMDFGFRVYQRQMLLLQNQIAIYVMEILRQNKLLMSAMTIGR